ncbi:MAG: hypothetical protein U1F55_14705 [Chitinivorax sp.]
MFQLARVERDAWLNWPARVSVRWHPGSASTRPPCVVLEAAVREHLQELGEMRPRVD